MKRLGAAAVGALLLSAPAYAQDNATVGSPLLKDFKLPGTQTTPAQPPAQQPSATPNQPPVVIAPPPPVVQGSRSAPISQTRPATRPKARVATPRQQPGIVAAPASTPPVETAPAAIPQSTVNAAPQIAGPAPQPALPQPAVGTHYALWAALAAMLAALVGFVLFRRSNRFAPAGEVGFDYPIEPVPAPARIAPAPVSAPALKVDLRPWLELEFKPEKMVATDSEATVHFELLVKNVGKVDAHNVRIQARMFNATSTQKQDISLFFATPVSEEAAPMSIPPQLAAKFKSAVVMPKSNVRQIEVAGRSLFIPTVAINVLYEWADGRKGQTSGSFVIGTESKAQSEKMGPFRLDLGPRIYRQVGGRPLDLARAV